MKKTLLTAAVLGLIAVSAPLSTQAVTQVSHDRGYISVSTSANTEVAPDVAEISFAVQTSDSKSMQKATQLNKEASDRVLSVLSSMLNSSNGDYIKTSDFSASPIYSYSGSKRNLDKAIEAGATNVDNLNFSVSTYDAQCNDLLGIATKKAQSRAGLLAKNLGTTLDGVRTFDVSCNANNYNSPRMYMAKNMLASVADEAASGATSTTITGGVVKINANVNASFFVK